MSLARYLSKLGALLNSSGQVLAAGHADASVTQAKLAANVAGNGPAFNAYNSGTLQSVSSGTDTVIQFQTENFDAGGCYNNTGSTATLNGLSVPAYSFMPNVAGYYQINACQTFVSNATGARFIKIMKNGSVTAVNSTKASSSDWDSQSVSTIVYLNGTSDYVNAQAWHSSGTLLGYATSGWNNFSAAMVRAA